jgi:hypothetical protein
MLTFQESEAYGIVGTWTNCRAKSVLGCYSSIPHEAICPPAGLSIAMAF